MVRSSYLVLALAAASGAAAGRLAEASGVKILTKVSPVQKVIQLIDDMAGKVTRERDEAAKVFEEYAKFCDDESVAKEYAIKDSKEAIEQYTATTYDSKAIIETEDAKVSDLSTKISDTESELATAVALRNQEHESFVKTEKELLSTTEELSGAQEQIKKSMAFIQAKGGKMSTHDRQVMNTVVQSLGQIVEASFVTKSQKDHIAALLQQSADAQEDAAFMGEGGADAILSTLADMEEKSSSSLTEVRKGEAEAQQNGALLKAGLENEIKTAKKEKGESTSTAASTKQKLAQAEKDLAAETSGLAEDTAYLKDLKRDCQNRAQSFEVQTKDNNAELGALTKAKAILLKKFALVQTGTDTRDDAQDDAKVRVLKSIEQLGKRLHKTALIALAYRAASDPFGKIRGMVEDMIAKLLQEAAEEATQKAFCDKELGESKTAKVEKEGKLDKVNSRLEAATSTTSTLTEEIATLSGEIAENDAAFKTATDVRQKENAEFVVVEKDLSESQEACAAATEVLREYYEGASLVQTKANAGSKEVQDAQRDGSGILGVLEVAESDFAQGLAEARTVESQAKGEYDKIAEDSKMLKTTKALEIKGKESEVKSLKVSLTDLSSDKDSLTGELGAVLAYLDKLKPQCEVKVDSYAERKAAREEEIQGLKTALEVLAEN